MHWSKLTINQSTIYRKKMNVHKLLLNVLWFFSQVRTHFIHMPVFIDQLTSAIYGGYRCRIYSFVSNIYISKHFCMNEYVKFIKYMYSSAEILWYRPVLINGVRILYKKKILSDVNLRSYFKNIVIYCHLFSCFSQQCMEMMKTMMKMMIIMMMMNMICQRQDESESI